MTDHLLYTTTNWAPAVAPRSTQNHLLFMFSQKVGSPSVLLITEVVFEAGTCTLRTVATQPKPRKECYSKLAAFQQDNNGDRT